MRWTGNLEEFAAWFVAAETTDEGELTKALRSIPRSEWDEVYLELLEDLHSQEDGARTHQPFQRLHFDQPDNGAWHVTQNKKRLLEEENSRRIHTP